jgi:hypothetical protein
MQNYWLLKQMVHIVTTELQPFMYKILEGSFLYYHYYFMGMDDYDGRTETPAI